MLSTAMGLLLALAFTALATPVVRHLAIRFHVVDEPTARRVHQRSIPRFGGIAIVFGFFASLVLLLAVKTDVARALGQHPRMLVGLLAGSLMMAALGVFDDLLGVGAKAKLAVQVLASLAAYAAGFRIPAIHIPFMDSFQLGLLAIPVTVLWICAVVNALNLIDGLDGLAAGVAFFACLTNFVTALISGNVLVCLLSATLAGAILGFLFYNFNPATIFMGDSGSMFLGYVLATVSLFGAGSRKGGTAIALLVPILALGVPIMDMLITMLRRFLAGRSIFSADRGHIHHRLLDMGLTHKRAVLVLYALCVLFTIGALAVYMERSWQVGVSLAALVVGVTATARFVGYFTYRLNSRSARFQARSSDVELIRRCVPDALRVLDHVRTKTQLQQALTDFANAANLLELSVSLNSTVYAWQRETVSARQRKEAVRSHQGLSLGQSGGHVDFAWDSELGEVSPQADILLQLITDAVGQVDERLQAASAESKVAEPPPDESTMLGASVNS